MGEVEFYVHQLRCTYCRVRGLRFPFYILCPYNEIAVATRQDRHKITSDSTDVLWLGCQESKTFQSNSSQNVTVFWLNTGYRTLGQPHKGPSDGSSTCIPIDASPTHKYNQIYTCNNLHNYHSVVGFVTE